MSPYSLYLFPLSPSLPPFLLRALGHAANRGKVYILHPELFKVHTHTHTQMQ